MTDNSLPPVPDGWTVVELADRALDEGEQVFATRFMPNAPREGEEVWLEAGESPEDGWAIYRVERVAHLARDPTTVAGPERCVVRAYVFPLPINRRRADEG